MKKITGKKSIIYAIIVIALFLGYKYYINTLPLDKYVKHVVEKQVSRKNVLDTEILNQDIYIRIISKPLLSSELTLKSMQYDYIDILKKLKNRTRNDEFDRIVVAFEMLINDKYGDVQTEVVYTLKMDNETLKEINFDNYFPKNINKTVYDYYIHPRFIQK